MPGATLTPRQRQTANGRRKFLEKFPSPEARSEHFRELSRRSAGQRLVLSGDEVSALAEAYALLGRIAHRVQLPEPPDTPTEPKTSAEAQAA